MYILPIHIAIALTSVIMSTALAVRPSVRKVYASYGLVAATLASGTYLVVTMHTSLMRVCSEGLVYLMVAVGLAYVGQRRLAAARVMQRDE